MTDETAAAETREQKIERCARALIASHKMGWLDSAEVEALAAALRRPYTPHVGGKVRIVRYGYCPGHNEAIALQAAEAEFDRACTRYEIAHEARWAAFNRLNSARAALDKRVAADTL